MPWKKQAEELYFESKMGIGDIAVYLGVSRQSVSKHLGELPGYTEEKNTRKERNRERRREYKREKSREYRNGAGDGITADTIRREHDVAALILSREKY